MHLISTILLLTVPTVFGGEIGGFDNFDIVLRRQYECKDEVRKQIDHLWDVLVNKNRAIISFFDRGFTFTDLNGTENQDKDYVADEILLKLNTSITPKIFTIKRFGPMTYNKYYDDFNVENITASVQLGGLYWILTFRQFVYYNKAYRESHKWFPLKTIQMSQEKPVIYKEIYDKFAKEMAFKLLYKEALFTPDFTYKLCENEEITNNTEMIAYKLSNLPLFSESVHYFVERSRPYKCIWPINTCYERYMDDLIQFKVHTSDGKKHMIEVDHNTYEIRKGMEYYCDEPKNLEAAKGDN